MSTKPKIKIIDNAELRLELDSEYEKSSQVKLCKYALCLATHVLNTIQYEDMNNPIIKEGYCVNKNWQNGKARMYDVRQASFRIHQLARNNNILIQTALRVVGQAVATGHMKEHAMVASDYAIKVINLVYPNKVNAIIKERLWQIEHLKAIKEVTPR